MNVLIISGHPDLKNSVANAIIIDELQKKLPTIKVHKLDELYPDYLINVEVEQKALLKADLIVWQFPYYWYSLPALMKKWLDDVFLHGFSHGRTAKLSGKKLLVSFTTGAPKVAYSGEEGSIGNERDLVTIFAGVARLCQLDYQGFMSLNGVSYINRENIEEIQTQQAQAREYAWQLIDRIKEIENK